MWVILTMLSCLHLIPYFSHRGILLCAEKVKKKAFKMEVFAEQAIYTPYSLPMYREDGKMGGKFKLSHVMRRNRYDPSKMQVLLRTGMDHGCVEVDVRIKHDVIVLVTLLDHFNRNSIIDSTIIDFVIDSIIADLTSISLSSPI